MKKIKKLICFIVSAIMLFSITAYAETYPSYNYLANGEITSVPQPFAVDEILYAENFGALSFAGAKDIFCDKDGNIYVADTENDSIAVLQNDGSTEIIKGFTLNGKTQTFNSPRGICVMNSKLYVCDYENHRIAIIDLKTREGRVIENVVSKILDDDFSFNPKGVAVDDYDRVYCVSDGQYNGLMVFEKDGSFSGFVGANKTSPSIIDIIWRKLSTKAQKAQQSISIPTEFSSVTIDKKNFVYTTTSTVDTYNPEESEPVRKQSPGGDNILKHSADLYPIGDIDYSYDSDAFSGPSRFCDIAVWDNMMYSVLDQTRNRIFTYDSNGSLLFVFGSFGENEGYFRQPVALTLNKNRLYVLDSKTGAITVLSPTNYADKLITAVDYTSEGDYNSALSAWSNVLEYNTNNELAYLNISTILLNQGDYEGAMVYAKQANNQKAYSEAFAQVRSKFIGENIGAIIIGAIFAIITIFILYKLGCKFKVLTRLKNRSKTVAALDYGRYILYAPFDGFWEQKREKRGNIASGIVIMVFLFLSFSLASAFTGFSFTTPKDELTEFNLLLEIAKTVLPIGLWCISNWCITALIEGSGNLKEIFISTCFALIPYTVASLISTLLSHFLTLDEKQVLTIIVVIGLAYSALLIIAATCSVHDCSMGKALVTILLTVIGMVIIVFISVLFFNLLNKFFDFAISIYNELRLRT